jgi:hypothetical protein
LPGLPAIGEIVPRNVPYFRRNGFVQTKPRSNIRERPLKATVLVLLLMLPWSVAAQTPRPDTPYAANFRACVRSHAADAQAAGVRTANEVMDYFEKVCLPSFSEILQGSSNTSPPLDNIPMGEAVQPGLLRVIVKEEWRDFTARGSKQ